MKNFLQKVHVEKQIGKNRQKFRCQFFLDFCDFIAFLGVSQRWEFKTNKKNCKTIGSKSFYKNPSKNPKPIFSRFVLITFLGVSWWGDLKNTIKNIEKADLTLVLFLASDPSTHHGGHRFRFGGPLRQARGAGGAAPKKSTDPPYICWIPDPPTYPPVLKL
jgi:hypothetical protein